MPDLPTSEHDSDFVCDCEDWMRSACAGEPFYKEHEGRQYCVLHFPGEEKTADFQTPLNRKLENRNFDFCGVWFPDFVSFYGFAFDTDASFNSATFSADASFNSATFSADANFNCATFNADASFNSATFSADANFNSAIFHADANFDSTRFNAEANFNYASFSASANFDSATFGKKVGFYSATFSAEAYFNSVTFSDAADFNSATFSEAYFNLATFSADANFNSATFSEKTNFNVAIFNARAYFDSATFSAETDFTYVTFKSAATFNSATFEKRADFADAVFKESADFNGASFGERVLFTRVTFGDFVRFSETSFSESPFNLQFARIEKPERVSFDTVTLRPHWFVNVDSRAFEFSNVKWEWQDIHDALGRLAFYEVSSSHRTLSIACQRLADNAEQNNRYEEASLFRFRSMEARRWESWRGFAPKRLSWWYWLASGYGERVFQAFLVLLGIWFVAAFLYTRVGFARWEPRLASESDVVNAKRDEVGAPLPFKRALTYSLSVMTLQKPEPRPATTAAQAIVLLETILGPIQAALLALAIRRKFMR